MGCHLAFSSHTGLLGEGSTNHALPVPPPSLSLSLFLPTKVERSALVLSDIAQLGTKRTELLRPFSTRLRISVQYTSVETVRG